MYINNDFCPYKIRKDENKCSRIFRPWDTQISKNFLKDNAQDSTVSTTTKDEELASNGEEKFEDIKSSDIEKDEFTSKSYVRKSVSSPECHDTKTVPSPSSNVYCSPSKISNCRSPVSNKCSSNHPLRDSVPLCPKSYEGIMANPDMFLQSAPLPIDYIPDPYNTLSTDLVQSNLAQHLGLPPNDPLLLESLAQGYALEEYARVLSQEQQAKLMAARKQRPKKYKCPHCDVGFSNNGQLKGHIRIHTGERPFKCDEKDCGKTFTRNEELTRHKRIHSGLRPFPCSHCGKRFGRKDHLKKHSRTHFQPRGLYAVPVVLPFEAWASGQTSGYPFFPVMY